MRARHGKRRVLQFPPTSLFRSSGTYVSQTRSSMRLHASSTSARQRELTLAAAQMSFIAGRPAPRWLEGHASSALTIHSITSRSSASGRSASTRGMAAAFVGSLQQRTRSAPIVSALRGGGARAAGVFPLQVYRSPPPTHNREPDVSAGFAPARSEKRRPNALKRPHDPSHGAQRAPLPRSNSPQSLRSVIIRMPARPRRSRASLAACGPPTACVKRL